ncbi:DUF2156 domain-containing protein [Asaccharospora irregularis]|uniref:Phosphatidylglycerol lysyltransferase C-terminal domain-containing protein n=1 Tax=Asaccharospora irregularis DSM 2635 TaxID=1121321 RepID=A0A1M5M3R5_9FIRM|nr:phosphatidylglycerol lysyltransferase domain-containing protein [Asaccharospora irregularis]SHG71954.1 hypothetical protein SAMN04488530_10626 [Asaccharospora irregularis DSM 2635]
MLFKNIDINSKKELDPYFDMVDYEACEYCFTTLYMWQHVYKTGYYIGDDFAVLVGEYEGNSFSILPLATKERLPEVIDFVIDYFKNINKKVYLRGITKEIIDVLNETHPGKFEYIEERDLFDYIYDAESLRTLAGRKNQKKRNHINYFLKEYDGRFEYKLLDKENFDECLKLMKDWTINKEEHDSFDEGMDDELVAIKKIFNNYDILKDRVKVFGIYIDGKLEAFSIGEFLNENMALIHIEKANPEIRGLYPLINQQFLVKEFADVEFVNREEDLGIEGLRKAKLSYHPCRFVEKYTVRGL